jgi:hypothetical protein
MGTPRTENEIVAELHEIQREEDRLRDRKRALDDELVARRRIEAEHRDDSAATVVRVGA